jgi:uroporphyrinogen III methyltransferase / synthase
LANPSKPLGGKRIVVTRAPEQSGEFVDQLNALGAEVLLFPLLSFCEPEDSGPLDEAVRELDKFDWIIFTSRNAVKFFGSRFKALRTPPDGVNRLILLPRVATIGSATSDEARRVGFVPNYEAQKPTAEGLGAELLGELRGKRVLLPRSDIANSALPRTLREARADLIDVVAYRTLAPKPLDTSVAEAIRQGSVDVVTLFSPSAYHHLIEEIGLDALREHSGNALRRHSGKIVLATIGPTTSSAVRSDGLRVGIEARDASAAVLCEAIVDYFQRCDSSRQ